MTRDEQSTERALIQAQAEWLRARGWVELVAGVHRWRHQSAPANTPALCMSDAMAFTKQEPLRYRKGR